MVTVEFVELTEKELYRRLGLQDPDEFARASPDGTRSGRTTRIVLAALRQVFVGHRVSFAYATWDMNQLNLVFLAQDFASRLDLDPAMIVSIFDIQGEQQVFRDHLTPWEST